jgi:hypothetical protein
MPFAELPSQSAGARADADRVLRQAGNLQLLPDDQAAAGPAETLTVRAGSTELLSVRPGCQLLQPQPAGPLTVQLELPPAGISISSPVSIGLRVRRFGPTLAAFGSVPPGQVKLLRPLPDGSPVTWLVQLTAAGSVRLCSSG